MYWIFQCWLHQFGNIFRRVFMGGSRNRNIGVRYRSCAWSHPLTHVHPQINSYIACTDVTFMKSTYIHTSILTGQYARWSHPSRVLIGKHHHELINCTVLCGRSAHRGILNYACFPVRKLKQMYTRPSIYYVT